MSQSESIQKTAVRSATQMMIYTLSWAEWGWRGPALYVAASFGSALVLWWCRRRASNRDVQIVAERLPSA